MEFSDNILNDLKTKTKGSLTTTGENDLSEKYSRKENQRNPAEMYIGCRTEKSSEGSDKFSFFTREEDLTLNRALIFCNLCKDPYYFIFLDNLDLSLDCGCSKLKNMTIQEYKREYNKFDNNNNLEQKTNDNSLDKDKNNYLLHCKKHPKEKEFEFYCTDCKYDLCKECLNEISELYTNTNRKYKTHENHTKIKLDSNTQKIEKINDFFEKYKGLDDFKYNAKTKEKIKDIFSVIKAIIYFYKEYKCYNFYKSIESAEKFLDKVKSNFNFGKHEDYFHFIKITSEKNLDKIKNFSQNILTINIMHSENPIDLSYFENINFSHLEELVLVNDKINDVKSLFCCKFPSLKKFHLENNLIGNEVIELFKNVEFPEITFISLYVNKITNLEIFNTISKFGTLKAFHIGENKFDFKTDSKDFYKFPENIEEFGMTGNFDGNNVEFIKKLDIGNLITFYFSRNKLKDLKSLKGIKFKRLYRFWAISNKITDINEIRNLENKDELVIINLKENQIKNFDKLFDFINEFPKLETLTVSYNGIEKEEVDKMKNRIKEVYNRDVDIIVE